MRNQGSLVLLLGSNSGDRLAVLENAITEIQNQFGSLLQKSSIYESKAWGFDGQDFLNQVVIVHSDIDAFSCLKITQEIEKNLGRQKKSKNGVYENRIIDIDILFYENLILETEELCIPHPKIQDRRFTLQPLAEILSDYVHPQLKKNIGQLLIECLDKNEATKLNG
jgi:2-amino-4-hydroxy-6-hydroxymethyldihydropteridine diphosphokinase